MLNPFLRVFTYNNNLVTVQVFYNLLIKIKPYREFCIKAAFPRRMASELLSTVSSFKEVSDVYSCVTVDTTKFSLSENEFESNLCSVIPEWTKSGVRGIWFRVHINDTPFIPILVKNGFVFHHAKESYAMLTKWLLENEPESLPQFPFTHVGVGGLVVNDKNEVLVVQEKFRKRAHWKLPGGYSKQGEEFADTAKREILEETGIHTEFVSVISLRHYHKHIFDSSDIYVVCHMRPLNSEITKGVAEISQCQWMDIEAYRNHSEVTEFNKFVMEAFLRSQQLKAAFVPSSVISFNRDTFVNTYSVKSLSESKDN